MKGYQKQNSQARCTFISPFQHTWTRAATCWCLRLALLGSSHARSRGHNMSSGTLCSRPIFWKMQRQQRLTLSGASFLQWPLCRCLPLSATRWATNCVDNTRTGTSKAPSKEPMFVEYSGKKLDASANSERSRSEAPSLLHSRDDKACHAQMTTLASAATSLREQVRQAEWGAFNSVPRHLHGILVLLSSSSSTSPSSENTGEQQTWISPTWIEKHDPSL